MIDFPALLLASAVALVASLLLTPAARNLFLSLNILDRPDGVRKAHPRPVPRIGGIPITFAYVLSCGLLLLLPQQIGPRHGTQFSFIVRLLPAGAVVFTTGLIDDVLGLKPWQKLIGQFASAVLAFGAGVRIYAIGEHPLNTPVSFLITVLWLIGCANAFNLIDGLDGLASGMALFATLTSFVAALLHRNDALAVATLPLAGAILGFLRYNFNPASVFLGDSGSLFLGFLLGSYGVIWTQKSATLLSMTAPAMALAIPLLDTALAIGRRWLRGQPIFSADRNHIHHRLLARGLTQRRVVLLLYSVCCLYASLSLLQSVTENRFAGVIVVLFCLVTWFGIQHLGYIEFGIAGRAVFGGALRKIVHGQIALQGVETQLLAAATVEECWSTIEQIAREFGFAGVEARLRGRLFTQPIELPDAHTHWQLRVPLLHGDYVVLSRSPLTAPAHGVLMPIVEALYHLGERLPALAAGETAGVGSSLASLAVHVEQFEPDPAPRGVPVR